MQMRQKWTIRLATFALWLLAAASGVFWVLKLVQGTSAPANAAVVTSTAAPAVDSAALARSLGGGQVAVAPSAGPAADSGINASRFVLTGVVVGNSARQGIALVAVDGKPARPYRIGGQLSEGVLLQSVESRQAVLASAKDAPAGATLELPKQASAVVGSAMPAPPPQPTIQPQIALPAPTVMAPSATSAQPFIPGFEPGTPPAATGQNPARPGASRSRANRELGGESGRKDGSASPAAPATM